MGIRKKKGKTGVATHYMPKSRALRLLQISFQDFERLCVLKGIYPREPNHRVKAQKGDCTIKILYLKSDIRFLLHEPIIWKLREERIRRRKLKGLKVKNEKEQLSYLRTHAPVIKLDHIVLERYPTFIDALKDLDDALSACFLYAALFSSRKIESDIILKCRKLTVEFMSYIIEAKKLRKVFVTFKGYYYRANIQGVDITWLVPHPFPVDVPKIFDTVVMSNSLHFYTTLLSFANYRLYQSLNLVYPVRVDSKLESKKKRGRYFETLNLFYSLNTPLHRTVLVDDDDKRAFDPELFEGSGMNVTEVQRSHIMNAAQKKVFIGYRFFLGREINRESLIFVIRSAGGEVSWDASLGPGSTFTEDDNSVTHQVVDRPMVDKKSLKRYYIQPQWVYDSFNFAIHLPMQEYFIGADLPPHLSPFEETYDSKYVPPELVKMLTLQRMIYFKEGLDHIEEKEEKEDSEDENEEVDGVLQNGETKKAKIVKKKKPKRMEIATPDDHPAAEGSVGVDPLNEMAVTRGVPLRRNIEKEQKKIEEHQEFMAKKLIHRKLRRTYRKFLMKEKREESRSKKLQMMRERIDKVQKKKRDLLKNTSVCA